MNEQKAIVLGCLDHRFCVWEAVGFNLFVSSISDGLQCAFYVVIDLVAEGVKLDTDFLAVSVVLIKCHEYLWL